MMARRLAHRPDLRKKENGRISYPEKILSYRGNVANSLAEKFYREHGVEKIEPAFECKRVEQVPLMFTRHCIRFYAGILYTQTGRRRIKRTVDDELW